MRAALRGSTRGDHEPHSHLCPIPPLFCLLPHHLPVVASAALSLANDADESFEPPLNSSGAKPSGGALGGMLLKATDSTKAIATKGKTATERGAAKPTAEPAATRSDSRYAPHEGPHRRRRRVHVASRGGVRLLGADARAALCCYPSSFSIMWVYGMHTHVVILIPAPLCCSSACCPSICLSPHPPSASVPLTAPVRASR